jgi:5-methylcytosine-specific restriction endonuclease McrA
MTATEAAQVEGFGKRVVRPAYIVDHIIRLRLDFARRFDYSNLRSYCLSCHSRKTRIQDKRMERKQRINDYMNDLDDFS